MDYLNHDQIRRMIQEERLKAKALRDRDRQDVYQLRKIGKEVFRGQVRTSGQ